jgi:hypothetical protein
MTSGGIAAVRNYREANYVSSAFGAAGVGVGSDGRSRWIR